MPAEDEIDDFMTNIKFVALEMFVHHLVNDVDGGGSDVSYTFMRRFLLAAEFRLSSLGLRREAQIANGHAPRPAAVVSQARVLIDKFKSARTPRARQKVCDHFRQLQNDLPSDGRNFLLEANEELWRSRWRSDLASLSRIAVGFPHDSILGDFWGQFSRENSNEVLRHELPEIAGLVQAPVCDLLFISYRRTNEKRVTKIEEELEKRGVKPWRDRSVITAQDQFGDSISAGISAADAYVVVFSRAYFGSKWTKLELNAIQNQINKPNSTKRVVIVVLDKVEVPALWQTQDHIRWSNAAKVVDLIISGLRGS